MPSYVEVPREALVSSLDGCGFSICSDRSGELVYERAHHKLPTLRVRVFTSLSANGQTVRGRGKDAIRVALVYCPTTGLSFGLGSSPRVYRSGTVQGVIERLTERMREVYKEANHYAHVRCPKCGAPTYPDSRRCIVKECRG